MLRGIWSLAKLDLLRWRRNPLAVLAALLPPLSMVLLLKVLSLSVTAQPVALVVEGHGPHTAKMAQVIRSDDDAYLLRETDRKEAARELANLDVAAVITIPANFDEIVDRHEPGKAAVVKLELNNVDIDFADDIRRSVQRSVYRYYVGSDDDDDAVGGEKADTGGAKADAKILPEPGESPFLVQVIQTNLRQTNVEWMNYQMIPALVLLILNVSLTGTALLCAQDVERKTARYLLTTPQVSWALVGGRLLGGFLAGMIALLPAVVICAALHVIAPPLAHWPALMAIFAATALCASGLGAILGTALSGTRVIAMAACVTATYMFLLGGGFTTIAFLPQWLREIGAFVPIRYAIDGMRQALFYKDLHGVLLDITVLSLTAVLSCVVGSLMVRRSWRA